MLFRSASEDAGGPSFNQQRVDIFKAEVDRLTNALAKAREKLAFLQDRAGRPINESVPRPEQKDIKEAEDAVNGYERQLLGVQRQLDSALSDLQSGIEPVQGREPVKKEQLNLFGDADEAAKDLDKATKDLEKVLYGGKFSTQRVIDETFGAPTAAEKAADEAAEKSEQTAPAPKPPTEMVGPPTLEGSEAQPGLTGKQVGKEGVPDEFSANHVLGTPEGRAVQEFFGAVKSATKSPGEIQKHLALLQNIAKAFTEYDIVRAGRKVSNAMREALAYLQAQFGGVDGFKNTLARMRTMSPEEQSKLFRSRNMPDLTTRRGLEDFQREVEQHLEQSGFTGTGAQISPRSRTTGKGIFPYTEDIVIGVSEAKSFEPMESGKPRSPEMRFIEKLYKISDTRIRQAVMILRQKIEGRLKLTPEDIAAKTYLDNKARSTFGDVMRDLAFDLAMFKLNPDEHGANAIFRGEGGKYAEQFRAWLERNTDKNTIELLDQLVADYTATYEANKKFDEYKSEYNRRQEKLVEEKHGEYEKQIGRAHV